MLINKKEKKNIYIYIQMKAIKDLVTHILNNIN